MTQQVEISNFIRTFADGRTNRMILFSEVKMEVKVEVMRYAQEVKPASWLDNSLGCCLTIRYYPFITSTSAASLLPFLLPF